MKKMFAVAVVVAVMLVPSTSAFAICQTCRILPSGSKVCWTLSATEAGAQFSACAVVNGECDGFGTAPGPECNTGTGGGNSGGTGGTGGGGDQSGNCVANSGGCPADCGTCQ